MEIRNSWFGDGIPLNAKPATAVFGVLPNALVTITTDQIGEEANDYTFEIVEGVGNDVDMSASLVNKSLVITLGTDGMGALDPAKNTAELIVDEINGIALLSAGFSGDGSGIIDFVAPEDNFDGGQFGTFCPDPFVVVRVWNVGNSEWDYFTAIAPNDKYDANWRHFNLTFY